MNEYRPLSNVDQGFPIACEPTLGTLRTFRRLQVRAALLPSEKRREIARMMCWDEDVVSDALGEDAYYAELGGLLFGPAFTKAISQGDEAVSYKEVLRALADFL